MDKLREAAAALVRYHLDAAEVHPCDAHNDDVRALACIVEVQNLRAALAEPVADEPVAWRPAWKDNRDICPFTVGKPNQATIDYFQANYGVGIEYAYTRGEQMRNPAMDAEIEMDCLSEWNFIGIGVVDRVDAMFMNGFKRGYRAGEKAQALYTRPAAAPVLKDCGEPAPGYCKHCKKYTIAEPLPAEPVADEPVAWMIECTNGFTGWWCGHVRGGLIDCRFFDKDPNRAVVFPSKESAEAVIQKIGHSCMRATSHQWMLPSTRPAAAPAERGEYPPLPPPDYVAGEKGMLGEDCYAASTVRRLLDADRAQQLELPPDLSLEQLDEKLAAWLHLNLYGYVDAPAHGLRERIVEIEKENAELKTVMVAAAEEIHAHWDAHCDAEGYGPQNLMRRLEEGIPSEYGYTAGAFAAQQKRIAELEAQRVPSVSDEMVSRFLAWPLPKDFYPDCGISFDGRKDDEWNKNKTWPTGTNLLTAEQARAMLRHVLCIGQSEGGTP